MHPFIRWAGSKRQVVAKLRPYWGDGYVRYIEPFAGSACFFFNVEPAAAVLGDINAELIATFQAVRRNPSVVIECLNRLKRGKREYYHLRSLDPLGLPECERAARFLHLNRYCFNGLYRTNTQGNFNVPYGPPKKVTRLNEASIIDASRLLQRATLLNHDFERTLKHARAGDFVYLDPPYVVAKRRVFAEYAPGTFKQNDLIRLRTILQQLDSKGVAFVITYADCAEARKLLADFTPRRIWTRRHIAGFASKRRGSYELLATNINV